MPLYPLRNCVITVSSSSRYVRAATAVTSRLFAFRDSRNWKDFKQPAQQNVIVMVARWSQSQWRFKRGAEGPQVNAELPRIHNRQVR
jgi:hypothetical protein